MYIYIQYFVTFIDWAARNLKKYIRSRRKGTKDTKGVIKQEIIKRTDNIMVKIEKRQKKTKCIENKT